MAQTELERRFEKMIRDSLPAMKKFDYVPRDFIDMMNEKGAAQAVRDLMMADHISQGFTRLVVEGYPEYTAKALVADQPEWAELFTEEHRKKARRRLEDVHYKFRNAPFTAPQQQAPQQAEPEPKVEPLPTGEGPLRVMAEATLRPEQTQFREGLRQRYGDACQISGCSVMTVVQACHLVPVSANGTFDPENGLLLKVDLHVLFDANLIAVEPETLTVHVAPELAGTEYEKFQGSRLRVGQAARPNRASLLSRWSKFKEKHG